MLRGRDRIFGGWGAGRRWRGLRPATEVGVKLRQPLSSDRRARFDAVSLSECSDERGRAGRQPARLTWYKLLKNMQYLNVSREAGWCEATIGHAGAPIRHTRLHAKTATVQRYQSVGSVVVAAMTREAHRGDTSERLGGSCGDASLSPMPIARRRSHGGSTAGKTAMKEKSARSP